MSLRRDAVVIGAGFAGLSAAVRLADAGRSVTVLEEAPRCGGRATAFTDRETGARVDNGQHVLFGCYRETYRFLARLGSDQLAPPARRLALTMIGAGGRVARLSCPPLPPPWHLVAGVLAWNAVPLRDRLSAAALRPVLQACRREGAEAVARRIRPEDTVDAWLAAHGQTPLLSKWLWHPLAIAALNQSPAVAAAEPFVRVLGELFGPSADDSSVGLPIVPLDELYVAPAVRFIEAHGGEVKTKASARIILDQHDRVRAVRAGDRLIDTERVVSAVPWHSLARIWDTEPPAAFGPVVGAAAAMTGSPIVTVNLWFDRAVMTDRFVGLVDGPFHWVFDKGAIFGGKTGHLSMVASGADGILRLENAEMTRLALDTLGSALPGVRTAQLTRSVVVREPRATFSLAPGGPARPSARTAIDGLYLAGDWTDTGLPATIEGAVTSGHRAADLGARLTAGAPGGVQRLAP